MQKLRTAILALTLIAGTLPVFAQVPPPVPALPDAERRISYSITSSTCACSLGANLALYGDSTDYQNWVEVFLNGVRVNFNDATFGWTITSQSGTPLANLPRPITDGVLTFANPQTGTVQIVGARRPRRIAQFNENAGIPARNFNQILNDMVAQNRELWDKTNDMTGRGLFSQPGNTMGLLPLPAACANGFLGFDATGLNPLCRIGAGTGNVVGPGTATPGDAAVFGSSPTLIVDAGSPPALTANNLSDLANKSTARTNLGVAIGSNVEAWDADLDCLAALGTTGVIQRTGAGTCAALTSTQLTALINTFSASLSGAVPASGGGTSNFLRADGSWVPATSGSVSASSFVSSAYNFGPAINLQINASVASNNLTISIVGNNGSTPSSANPILVAFRDSTVANGNPVTASIQAATSFTINSGNTMGATSGVPFRLWIVAVCQTQSGTTCTSVLVGAINCSTYSTTSTAGSIFPLNEYAPQGTGAGTSGGSTAGTIFTSVASLSGKPIRILGYMEWSSGLTTAGTWASAPTNIQLFGPGVPRPGQVVQTIITSTGTQTTTTGTTYIATNSTVNITLTSAANLVKVRTEGGFSTVVAGAQAFVQWHRNPSSTNLALGGIAWLFTNAGGDTGLWMGYQVYDFPGTTSQVTYTLFLKSSTSGDEVKWADTDAFGGTGNNIAITYAEEIMG